MTPNEGAELNVMHQFLDKKLFYVIRDLMGHYHFSVGAKNDAQYILQTLFPKADEFCSRLERLAPGSTGSFLVYKTFYGEFWEDLENFENEVKEKISLLIN